MSQQLNGNHRAVGRRTKIGIGLLALAATIAWMLDLNALLLPNEAAIDAEQARRAEVIERVRRDTQTRALATAGGPTAHISSATGPKASYGEHAVGGGKPFPTNGAEWAYGSESKLPLDGPFASVTFRDVSGDGLKKVLRIRRHGDPELLADVYLRPGTADGTSLPPGLYDVSVGAGEAWYGPAIQFGPTGRYYRLRALEVQAKGAFVELRPVDGETDKRSVILTDPEDF
jgi:hypothetical protein